MTSTFWVEFSFVSAFFVEDFSSEVAWFLHKLRDILKCTRMKKKKKDFFKAWFLVLICANIRRAVEIGPCSFSHCLNMGSDR